MCYRFFRSKLGFWIHKLYSLKTKDLSQSQNAMFMYLLQVSNKFSVLTTAYIHCHRSLSLENFVKSFWIERKHLRGEGVFIDISQAACHPGRGLIGAGFLSWVSRRVWLESCRDAQKLPINFCINTHPCNTTKTDCNSQPSYIWLIGCVLSSKCMWKCL